MQKLIIILAALGLSGVVLADEPRDAAAPVPAAAEAQGADETLQAEDGELAAKTDQRHCLRATGSRIRRADHCIAAPGVVYDQDDLSSTGGWNAAEALRKLDPSITVRR